MTKLIYFHGDRKKKEIALTFDDGPCEETKGILKVLKKENIKATFFVMGRYARGKENLIRKIKNNRNEIGNHTENHLRWPSLMFKTQKIINREILLTDKSLLKSNVITNLFRPPKALVGFNLIRVCKKQGKKIVLFDVDSRDWAKPGVSRIARRVLRKAKNGSIIVFHDYIESIGKNKDLIPALKIIIPELKRRGFKFVVISKLIK